MRIRPRFIAQFLAWLNGYFWIHCPVCGDYFSGFESGQYAVNWNGDIGEIACNKLACQVEAQRQKEDRMKKHEIICDACGYDITYTGNCEDWRLVLGNESKTPWYVRDGHSGGMVTSMAISRPVDRTYHFCGIGCLNEWITKNHPDAGKDYARKQELSGTSAGQP